MKVNRVAALAVACVYVAVALGAVASVQPVLGDSEFFDDGGGSDGAWGWRPPNRDSFGASDGIGRGGSDYADNYGSGNGPFGGGDGPFGGGRMAGRTGLLGFLVSLISGSTGMVGNQRNRSATALMNLQKSPSKGGAGSGNSPDSRGRIRPPSGSSNFFDAP